MTYDVASVRGLYSGLSDGWTYLNAHDTPQIPERVTAAVARSFRMAPAVAPPEENQGSHARRVATGRPWGDSFVDEARVAIADIVGGTASNVILGHSLPELYEYLAEAMTGMLGTRSTAVLQGEALNAFKRRMGADKLRLLAEIDGSTRLVVVSAADALSGATIAVDEVVAHTREHSRGWVMVDVSDWAPYRLIDMESWGADILALDIKKMGGPDIAALVFRSDAMFKRIELPGSIPVSAGLAGGVNALVDHYADLVSGVGTRRDRLARSIPALSRYLTMLREDLQLYLGALPSVEIIGGKELPRMGVKVHGVPSTTVQQRLFDNGLVTAVNNDAVTIALAPFNTGVDVTHLVRVIASLG